MKFGQRLKEEALPEWKEFYLDYGSLKKMIKGKWDHLDVEDPEGNPEGDALIGDSEDNIVEQRFLQGLRDELGKVNAFYLSREMELNEKLEAMENCLIEFSPSIHCADANGIIETEPPAEMRIINPLTRSNTISKMIFPVFNRAQRDVKKVLRRALREFYTYLLLLKLIHYHLQLLHPKIL